MLLGLKGINAKELGFSKFDAEYVCILCFDSDGIER